jgi:diadenosine tetraphosphate (Ap4A) HIT family hydrolase
MAIEGDCVICEFVSSSRVDSLVYEDDRWVAGVLKGLEVPGWLVLSLRRHALEAIAMDPTEAKELGPLIVKLSSALRATTDAERIYALSYGENAAHFHILLASRGSHIPPEHRHSEFWGHRAEYVDAPAAVDVASKVRAMLPSIGDPEPQLTSTTP